MWSSLDEVKESYRAWTTWDDWILATYRDRVDFASFLKDKSRSVPPEVKDYILSHGVDDPNSPRNAILRAIKKNDKGENYNLQTALYLFAKLCVFLIATSSGFVISSIFGAHIGLTGGGKIAVDIISFVACFLSNIISFRVSVPGVIRRLFEWDNFGWHFLAKKEMTVYKDVDNKVKTGYKNTDEEKAANQKLGAYADTPGEDKDLGWKSKIALFVQFGLVTIVGLAILAQTVEKSVSGMTGIFPALAGSAVLGPFAWTMGVAALFCMIGHYTFSVIRFLRQKDKTKELRAVFRSVDPEKKNYAEVYTYNAFMGLFALGLSLFVGMGMYGTSDVQAASFVKLVHASKPFATQAAICACSMGGKVVFTVRALFNFIGIIRAATSAAWNRVMTGTYYSPFSKRQAEDVVSGPGYTAIGLYAIAKSTTAVQTPEPGEVSELYSDNPTTQFFAWAAIAGAFIRTAQEPLDKLKPKDVDAPKPATAPNPVK